MTHQLARRIVQNRWKLILLILLIAGSQSSVMAEVVREDNGPLTTSLKMPVYEWSDTAVKPKFIVILLHGLTMHGATFDALSRKLARNGALAVSIDLRGYGRWYTGFGRHEPDRRVSYVQSQQDIHRLVRQVREDNPDLPCFAVGESMGADLAVLLESSDPALFDGLILSSPALKAQPFFGAKFLKDTCLIAINPKHKINVSPYIRYCASEDKRVRQEILDDPMTRKSYSIGELWHSLHTMKDSLAHASKIQPKTPILIIQGSADRTVKANAVVLLLNRLHSTDQTVRWFDQRGHVLLETSYLDPLAVEIVEGWIQKHTHKIPSTTVNIPSTTADLGAATYQSPLNMN